MSTSCTVKFAPYGGTVYKHWDGYPSEMEPLLERFFDTVEEETQDTRFNDAPYLAARFVVFLANEYRREGAGQMDFLSVGITDGTNQGEEYTYTVKCVGGGKRPEVSVY